MQLKYLLNLILILLISMSLSAQVDDMRKKSDDHNSGNNYGSDDNYGSSSDDDFGSELCGECCSILFSDFSMWVFAGLGENHKLNIETIPQNPLISSVSLGMNAGIAPKYSSYSYIPRLRLRRGLFSSDLRVHIISEKQLSGTESYTTIDWQVLVLNIMMLPNSFFRIGSGIHSEQYSGNIYAQHYAALEFGDENEKFFVELEAYYTPDYESTEDISFEVSGKLNYRILQKEKNYTYVNLMLSNTQYFESISRFCISAGLSFNFL